MVPAKVSIVEEERMCLLEVLIIRSSRKVAMLVSTSIRLILRPILRFQYSNNTYVQLLNKISQKGCC